MDLTGASALEFWARGAEGDEIVNFVLGVLDGIPFRGVLDCKIGTLVAPRTSGRIPACLCRHFDRIWSDSTQRIAPPVRSTMQCLAFLVTATASDFATSA